MLTRFALLFAASLLCAGVTATAAQMDAKPSAAAVAPGLTIDGAVKQPLHVVAADLTGLPPVRIHLAFKTDHGDEQAQFTGVPLLALLDRAGMVDAPGQRTHLQHTLLVTGRDGYAVALAIGELDPKFEHKSVLIAYERDGKPLPGGELRLVVPGDLHGGRSVRDVVRIEVR